MNNIAFLGAGAMGSRMIKNLLNAGKQVWVYNRNLERARALEAHGAVPATSPLEAVQQAEVVISMVTDDEASRQVWLDEEIGAVHGLRQGMIAIESSTLTPQWINSLAEEVSRKSAYFIDAPVVGSTPQAEAAALAFLVGADTESYQQVEGLFSILGSVSHHVGPVGQGIAMKLAVNALFGIQVVALSEVLGLVTGLGLDLDKAIAILNEMPTSSMAQKRIAGLIVERQFSANFPISLVEKDFRYVIETARMLQASTPASDCIHDVFASALREGYGDDDISGVAQLYV